MTKKDRAIIIKFLSEVRTGRVGSMIVLTHPGLPIHLIDVDRPTAGIKPMTIQFPWSEESHLMEAV